VFSEFKSVISSNLTVEKLLPVEKMEAAVRIADGLHLRATGGKAAGSVAAALCRDDHLARDAGIVRGGIRGTHDGDGIGDENAGEVIQGLTLHMNKVRQAAITREIIEIVSGASSTA